MGKNNSSLSVVITKYLISGTLYSDGFSFQGSSRSCSLWWRYCDKTASPGNSNWGNHIVRQKTEEEEGQVILFNNHLLSQNFILSATHLHGVCLQRPSEFYQHSATQRLHHFPTVHTRKPHGHLGNLQTIPKACIYAGLSYNAFVFFTC